ncbi:MAG: DNA polymerase III subunit delta' [Sulfurimonas sp.]|nr:DNA polymerase III subunit delta' [Sulfurimonas sp.]MDD3060554.1 DNA polymerase III subunit delta' [Sulfurimonas sp.]
MLASNPTSSHILITTEIESEVERLKHELHGFRVVTFVEDEFKIEHAKAVVAEAYISESQTKYIILASKNFNAVSQNSLLKALEEPPRNIEFIIISATKSNLLPTVRSRLPILHGKKIHKQISLDINLAKMDYAEVFAFLKENARVTKSRAQELVEELYYRATVVDSLVLSTQQLENFEKAYKLLELNSRPTSVLALLLMGFAREK